MRPSQPEPRRWSSVGAKVTNTGRVLSALGAEPGLSDAELRQRTGIDPHQQVNQICRRLEQEGYLRRINRADGRIGNYLTQNNQSGMRPAESVSASPSSAAAPRTAPGANDLTTMSEPAVKDSLLVLPCSGRKAKGGTSMHGVSVLDLLTPTLRGLLIKARQDVAVRAALDESRLLPAW